MKEKFNYDKSVKKARTMVNRWRRAALDAMRELHLAKEFINGQKKRQEELPSWSDYCAEIGLHCKAADFWLRKFSPYGLPKRKTTKRRKA